MDKRKFKPVPGYVGIFTRESKQTTRIKGQVKEDLSFYARYKKDGKSVRVYLGRQSKKLTPARASNMRDQLIEGLPVKLPKPRTGKTKPMKRAADMGDGSSDDYSVDPESRPPEYWTFDRLWEQYVETMGGADGWSNYKTDRGIYRNHVRRLVGTLYPQDITKFKVRSYRNKLAKKTVIVQGTLKSLETAKRKLAEALAAAKASRKKADKIRYQKQAEKAAAKVKGIERKIKANKRKLSPRTVESCIELIRRLANFGPEYDLCPGPPKKIEVKQIDNEKTEDLAPEQIAALWKACDEDSNQDVADMIRIALTTGLRRGSLFKLTWKNVNFQKNVIKVKAKERGGRHSKSGKQLRLPLSPEAKNILKARAAVADLAFSPYVFPGRDGGIRQDPGKAARRIVRAAGLPEDFRPLHGQRHAFASNLANTGEVDLTQIGELLGHSKNSLNMTKRYSHIRDEALKKAAGLMSDIVSDARAAAKNQDPEKGHKAG
jgi:integrase